MKNLEKNIILLDSITNEIKYHNDSITESELFLLIKKLEALVRKEMSVHYACYFTDADLAEEIISICNRSTVDYKNMINIVSLLGSMVSRYGLSASDKLFHMFISLANTKGVSYYVSLFITRFPQFQVYTGRWDYLVSIPLIAPKAKSRRNFYGEIKRLLELDENIPSFYKKKIICILAGFLNIEQDSCYWTDYQNIISLLNERILDD